MNYPKQYIKLLKQINESKSVKDITEKTHTDFERKIFMELFKAGYVDGRPIYEGRNCIISIRSNAKGREYQEELEQKIKQKEFEAHSVFTQFITKHWKWLIATAIVLATFIMTCL